MDFKEIKIIFNKYKEQQPLTFYFLTFYLGGILTYIIVFHLFFADFHNPMPLNEIGDFLAGAFSPIAFLFLYLGYKQQGSELQQNTKALNLQVQELNNSVQQQAELVRLTSQQLEIFKEKETLEIKKIIESVKPKFNMWVYTFSSYDGYNIKIENYGAKVTDVFVSYSNGQCIDSRFLLFDSGHIHSFTLKNEIISEAFFIVTYIDQLGYRGEIKLIAKKYEGKFQYYRFFPVIP